MIETAVSIDRERFDKTGVQPVVDEEMLAGLFHAGLAEIDADERPLGTAHLHLRPHYSWNQGLARKAVIRALPGQRLQKVGGFYDDGYMQVNCLPDIEQTNRTLRHESRHLLKDGDPLFVDEHNRHVRMIQLGEKARSYAYPALLSIGAGSQDIAFGEIDPFISSMAATGLLAGAYLSRKMDATREYATGYETDARAFADREDIARQFGQIIRYEPTLPNKGNVSAAQDPCYHPWNF